MKLLLFFFLVNACAHARVIRTEYRCIKDSDCPPHSPPALWNLSLATSTQLLCERALCAVGFRRCSYEVDERCCEPSDEFNSCEDFRDFSVKCSAATCRRNNVYAEKLRNVNPFVGPDARRDVNFSKMRSRNDLTLTRSSQNAEVLPATCASGISSNCSCTSDFDCRLPRQQCAIGFCNDYGVCDARPMIGTANSRCCTSLEQCERTKNDPCLVATACDTEGTEDGALLPTYRCHYARRSGTASCCKHAHDCAALANVNSCVQNVCTNTRCSLSASGYQYNAVLNLPCCHTTDDCYAASSPDIIAIGEYENSHSCMVFECSGDSQQLKPELRHKCVPRVAANCSTAAQSSEEYTPATHFTFNGCTRAAELSVDFFTPTLRLLNSDVPVQASVEHVRITMSGEEADAVLIAVELIDEEHSVEFSPRTETLKEEVRASFDIPEAHQEMRGSTSALKARLFVDPAEVDEEINAKLLVRWSDGSERSMHLQKAIFVGNDVHLCRS